MTEQANDKRRGQYKNIVNTADVDSEVWQSPSGKVRASGQEIAVALGAKSLGFCVITVAPGDRNCPFHFHHSEEEMFYVISGEATLRQGKEGEEEEVIVRPGDFISYPPGTGIGHQFINHSDAPFVYMGVSDHIKADVCEYPDSNKILIRNARMMMRRAPSLPYFDGED